MTVEVFLSFCVVCAACSFGFATTLLKLDKLKDEIRNLKKELKKEKR